VICLHGNGLPERRVRRIIADQASALPRMLVQDRVRTSNLTAVIPCSRTSGGRGEVYADRYLAMRLT